MPKVQFPYTQTNPRLGPSGLRPLLPLDLVLGQQSISVDGLLDTGSTINVLPHSIGLSLGAVWAQQTLPLPLAGSLAGLQARALAVFAEIASFPPVQLIFAWCDSDIPPVILGHLNFFWEFDVCFYFSKNTFDVKPK